METIVLNTTSNRMTNLAQDWVLGSGKTLTGGQEEYDMACIDFACDFQDAIGRGRIVHFDSVGHPKWKYHCAVEIDGMIHDLWTAEVMPTEEFLAKVLCGGKISYPCEEEEAITA